MSRFFKLIVALVVVALASGFRATMKMVRFQAKEAQRMLEILLLQLFLACTACRKMDILILFWNGDMLEKYLFLIGHNI